MRKAHVKVLPLGAIVFVLVMLGGVFPSMAQAVDLTINFVGSGPGGMVKGSPGPPETDPFTVFNNSSKTITITYDAPPSSPVVLTAIDSGQGADKSTFADWPSCPSPSGNQCTVVMNENQTVTVTFNLVPVTPVQQTLTVTKAGTGSGLVTSTPGGISCGNDCTEGYANGT
ncbi:hypothetical protein, partial [uncultured Nitrospira sp.]|uniref:hypothetical protein n=1 Tax=uncultured Nitrospira sp. TaxID=157176 RepID=UPI003140563B